MLNNILLNDKSYTYNRIFSTNLYDYPTPQVFHFVSSVDALTCGYSAKRRELFALKNYIDNNKMRNSYFDFSTLLTSEVKVINLSTKIVNEGLKKGKVTLRFVQSNIVLSVLQDTNSDGVLIQTVGPPAHDGEAAGLVLYEFGVIILFATWDLGVVQENFRSALANYDVLPLVYDEVACNPKWLHFMTSGNGATNTCPLSTFEMDIETISNLYKMTFFVDVEDKNWSNNPTFHPRGGGVSFGKNFVREENDALGDGLSVVESNNKPVVMSNVDMYNNFFRKVGSLHLAQPLILDKKAKYKIKIEIDC